MARQSDRHYNDFGGLDVRSNKLTQNPKYARGGVNFRYNYQDELQKMNGFQKKIPGAGSECGLMEYKFRDLNTGESKTEILGVNAAGRLNVLREIFLVLTKAGGSVASYSLFYNDVQTSWKIEFFNGAGTSLGSVLFPETDTVVDLKDDINALAITGLTASVEDEAGANVVSTSCLAYTLNTTIRQTITTGETFNSAWFWTQVVFPDPATVPFPEVVTQSQNPDYEGVTWVNLNNAIYITDGGWVMKYDGFQVARAGMPKVLGATNLFAQDNYSGFDITINAGGSNKWTAGNHGIRFQLCYNDPNGVTILGKVQPFELYPRPGTSQLQWGQQFFTIGVGGEAIDITIPSIQNDKTFPIYACRINGAQTILATTAPQTFNIDAGHNLQVGQALRVQSAPAGLVYYLEITQTTATTVTIRNYPSAMTFALDDNAVFNSCYMPLDLMGREQARNGTAGPLYGPYIRVLATIAGTPEEVLAATYYILDGFISIPLDGAQEFTLTNYGVNDGTIQEGVPFSDDDPEQVGADLPRAGRYLSSWQDIMMQAGRTPNPALSDAFYPTAYDAAAVLASFNNAIEAELMVTYTESALCDFQSVYWAESTVPEGFPQDGLHEFLISTPFNDEIRGMGASKDSFFAFKSRSTGYLTGSLPENSLQLEIMESDAGCACHKVIQDVDGVLFYMDANSGFWSVVAGRLPQFIGYGIQTYFKENVVRKLNFRKAVAQNFRFQDQYVCFIPGDQPMTFVYDYAATPTGARSAWYPWEGVDGEGGILATADDTLLFSSKTVPTLWLQKFTETKYDYSIHTAAVPFAYYGAWINFGLPTIDKEFFKVWINSIQGDFDLEVTQYGNYLEPEIATISLSFPAEGPDKLTVKEYVDVETNKLSAISVGFENNGLYEDVRIQGWEIEYNPGFDGQEARR